MLSRVSDPVRYNLGDTTGDTHADMPGNTIPAASGGTDTNSFVATADSVAAKAFEVRNQIGAVPPRF
jgi:hypothetical protein